MTDFSEIEKIKDIILQLLAKLGFDNPRVEYEESVTRGLIFNISVSDPFLLIGRHGSILHSLEILAQAVVVKKLLPAAPVYFKLDIDDYRIKREWYLKETARQAAALAKKTGRGLRLEPMPAYERRFVHAFLQDNFPEIFSHSFGEEPYRRITVSLKK